MRKAIFLLVLFLSLLNQFSWGQTHKWAFDLRPSSSGLAVIRAQAVDDSNNVYVGGNFRDSLYIGTDTFYFPSTSNLTIFIAKYDKDGNYLWGRAFTSVTSANMNDLVINSKGQIILYGHYSLGTGASISFDSYKLSRSAAVFVALFNSSGSFTGAKDLAFGFYTGSHSIALGKDDAIHATYYLNGTGSGWTVNSASSPVKGSGFVHVLAKYSADGADLKWQKNYSIYDVSAIPALAVDRFNQVYISSIVEPSVTIFGVTTGSTRTLFLTWFRPDGTLKDKITSSNTNTFASISGLAAIDSNSIYISGNTRGDSITLAGTTIKSLSADPNKPFYFVAEIKGFNRINWYRSTSHMGSITTGTSRMRINGDFLYFSSLHNSNGFTFGGFTTSAGVRSVVSKLDRLGNLLWYLPLNSTSPPLLTAIGSQDLLYSGGYTGQINLNPFTLTNSFKTAKPFIARTYDYSITRGDVYAGPYCAGDSIKIPYEVGGDFDTANVFIAELSDDKGEFFGGQLELGRLKYYKDSTIVGRLPLFKVASSNRYRIRITSTKPVVQSYYRLDTLNLLIYSTDKADPGNDTFLCYGDTLQLNTFGGTLWKWSPNYNMSDSTSRTPLVFPLRDTTYQIIIDDSSGCGAPDTASIKVSITKSPVFTSQSISDTLFCVGDSAALIANFDYGTASYFVSWYDDKNQLLKKTATTTKSDTLLVEVNRDIGIYSVLTDSCSILLDTAQFELSLYDSMKVISYPKDSIVCKGSERIMTTSATFPLPDSIAYRWEELSPNSGLLSTDSFLTQSYNQESKVLLSINNACLNETFKQQITIKTHEAIQTEITNKAVKDTFCFGENIRLSAASQGGNPSIIKQYTWNLNDSISDKDSIFISTEFLKNNYPTDSSFTIQLITGDGCTELQDTTQFSFFVKPKLEFVGFDWVDSTLCLGTITANKVNTKGGLSSGKHVVDWWYAGNKINNGKSINLNSKDFRSGTAHSVFVVLSDGCSNPDTAAFKFSYPDSLKVNITSDDVVNASICNEIPFTLKSVATGGNSTDYRYRWTTNGKVVDTIQVTNQPGIQHNLFKDSLVNFILEVTDGCNSPNAKDTFSFVIRALPVVSVTNDSISRKQQLDTLICRGQEVRYTVRSFYGNTATQKVKWLQDGDSVANTISFTFKHADQNPTQTDFELKVVSKDGCSVAQDTLEINIKVRDALKLAYPADTTICYGNSILRKVTSEGGKIEDHTYEWRNANTGALLGTGFELLLKDVLANLNLEVVLKDGCSVKSDTARFTVNVLQPLDISLNGDSICYGGEATLKTQVSGGLVNDYTYKWFQDNTLLTNSLDQLILAVDSQTSIQVIVTDGCTSFGDTATYVLAPRPAFDVLNELTDLCEPFQPNWNLQNLTKDNYSFQLFDIGNNLTRNLNGIANLNAGDYNFVFISKNNLGCEDSVFKTFTVKPKPDATFSWSPTTLDFENPNLNAVALNPDYDNYTWLLNNVVIGNEASTAKILDKVGFYEVTLSVDENGCYDTVSQTIEFVDTYKYLGVTAFSPNGDGLNDVFSPNISGAQLIEYQIFDRWGGCMYRGEKKGDFWDGTMQDKPAPMGNYLVLIQAKDQKGTSFYYQESLKLLR